MPAIKKKWIKASQDGDVPDEVDSEEAIGEEDKELTDGVNATDGIQKVKKPKKRLPLSPSILRGLDGEVLLEKRKRLIPQSEQKLVEWIDSNLEQRTEETIHLPHLYSYYTGLCQGDSSQVLDLQQFSRMIKEKFGKNFGIKENSVYKSVIKELKVNREKKKSGGIKMKEIVHEAINHFGNPWSGVRFFALKQFICSKYPALKIDLKPKLLKRSLEMGVNYDQIELVKGIGMAGYYRLPGAQPPSPTKKETKTVEGEEKDSEESAEENKNSSTDESAAKSSEENGEKQEDSSEEPKKRKPKLKKVEKVNYSHIRHGNPEKIEDTFPLAITYQSAPKTAATTRIRKYIQEKYGETVPDHKWRRAIESGVDKGYWEYVSGSGIAGKLHLLMDDFNPESEHLEDRICAGIIACHEPKAASANQIKKYISQYHPDFKVDERPDLFKKALQRGVSKNFIQQLSGLGASGSFQLTAPFVPSPSVLAGEDNTSEDEGDGYESDGPIYIPKGTKSRGIPKLKTIEVVPPSPGKSKKNKKQTLSSSRTKGKKMNYSEDSDQSDDEVQDTKKGKQSKHTAKKPKGKQTAVTPTAEEEDKPEYTPKKSRSRGGPEITPILKNDLQKNKQPSKQSLKEKTNVEKTSTKVKAEAKNGSKKTNETSPIKQDKPSSANLSPVKKNAKKKADEVEEIVIHENNSPDKPNLKRKPKSDSNSSPSKKTKKVLDEGSEEEEAEYTPRMSKSRGGSAPSTSEKPEPKKKSSKSKVQSSPQSLQISGVSETTQGDGATQKSRGRGKKQKK